jgi:hypothetical protein
MKITFIFILLLLVSRTGYAQMQSYLEDQNELQGDEEEFIYDEEDDIYKQEMEPSPKESEIQNADEDRNRTQEARKPLNTDSDAQRN